jgi:hypothetical protein
MTASRERLPIRLDEMAVTRRVPVDLLPYRFDRVRRWRVSVNNG